MRWVYGLCVLLVLLSACSSQGGFDSVTSRFVVEVAQPNPIPEDPNKEVYVVLVQEHSFFMAGAQRFAEHKDAELITFQKDFAEAQEQLQELQPDYLAFVSTPEFLTPDYVGSLDTFLRTIDEDPYLDVSYGLLTSRRVVDFEDYMDRLIAYEPAKQLSLYGLGSKYDHYENAFGIRVEQDCVQETFTAITCEQSANASSIARGFLEADVVIIDAHGYPDHVVLDDGEELQGSPLGLVATHKDDYELLTTNASLVMATSCLTGRITGTPSEVIEAIEPIITPASVQDSALLSTLQNGALNYIAAIHPALNNMLPQEELAELAFTQGLPLGEVLKEFKNRLLFTTQNQLPGKELDNYTHNLLAFSAGTWVLFGDPSAVLSEKIYNFDPAGLAVDEETFLDTRPCMTGFRDDPLNQHERRIEVTLQGHNAFYYHDAQVKSFPTEQIQGLSKEPLCIFSVEKKASNQVEFLTKELLYDDLGDEFMFALPINDGQSPLKVALKLSE